MKKFEIKYEEGKFWIQENDEFGPFESEITSWKFANEMANGFRFGLKYKEPRQRKWRISSAVTLQVESMLDLVKSHLRDGKQVIVITPDLEITFFK